MIDQNPRPDAQADEGSRVDIVVSTGADVVVVPDITSLSEEDALAELRGLGLVAGERTRAFDDEVPEGRVISQEPAAGGEVPTAAGSRTWCRRGQELVIVRPVVNRSEQDAIAALEGQDLVVAIDREFNDSVAEGFVIRQDPGAGQQLSPGDTVRIVVSRGPEPAPEPPPPPEPEPTPDPTPDPTEPPADDGDDGESGGLLG